jgi:hypothetical protein
MSGRSVRAAASISSTIVQATRAMSSCSQAGAAAMSAAS